MAAIQKARATALRIECQNNLRQIGLAVQQYYNTWDGQFFLHHPFEADVLTDAADADTFAEIYWEDKLMPFIGGQAEANEALSRQGLTLPSEKVYRCPTDLSEPTPFVVQATGQMDGVANRTSYLMNSQLSHKTHRYGRWSLPRFVNEVGTSSFIAFAERNADVFKLSGGNDPRQDDYDIWLGTEVFQPWLAYQRHTMLANYLYLDGHVLALGWDDAVGDMFPDKKVLTSDHSCPTAATCPYP
jgi:prepilin-type processing-associated H-X9-DG protein